MADRLAPARRLDGLRGRGLVRFAAMSTLIILGLSGLAVTQPLLDLLGNNAEFFVAGSYTSTQIVVFALVIALVPPLVGIAVVVATALVDGRAGTVALAVIAALFAGAMVLAILRNLSVDALWLVAVLAVASAIAAGWLVARFRAARLFGAYLAAANLLFVGTFLFTSEASALLVGNGAAGDVGEVSVPTLYSPVVVIVLDELPAATIMRGDGAINEERYPGFARLAEVSTWFRNASSRDVWTPEAVPAILTGTSIDEVVLATYDNHPRNLFTLLGNHLTVRRYEPITDLCPEVHCPLRGQASLSQALSDASIVYVYRVLPSSLRDNLPPIDNSWGEYGAEHDSSVDTGSSDGNTTADLFGRWQARSDDERSPRGQAATMVGEIAAVTGDPTLHFLHVNLPHFPWTLSPAGYTTTYSQARRPEDLDRSQPGYDFRVRVEYQLHSMQTGTVDALLDEALEHLMSLPEWDDTLLVVTSDHGIGLTPPDVGRKRVTEANRAEVSGATVHQAARSDDGRGPRRERPDDRRPTVNRRPARHRGRRQLGVRRPFAVRRERSWSAPACVDGCRRGAGDRRTAR